MITHVVLFRLIDRSPESINRTKEALLDLKGKIPGLRRLEAGSDVLKSERSYDLALIARFDSLKDLEAYQVHPAHVEVVKYIAKVKESSIAVDYES